MSFFIILSTGNLTSLFIFLLLFKSLGHIQFVSSCLLRIVYFIVLLYVLAELISISNSAVWSDSVLPSLQPLCFMLSWNKWRLSFHEEHLKLKNSVKEKEEPKQTSKTSRNWCFFSFDLNMNTTAASCVSVFYCKDILLLTGKFPKRPDWFQLKIKPGLIDSKGLIFLHSGGVYADSRPLRERYAQRRSHSFIRVRLCLNMKFLHQHMWRIMSVYMLLSVNVRK